MRMRRVALAGIAVGISLGFFAARALDGYAAAPVCVYRAAGALPDRRCTPGATNPAVTPGDVHSTICVPGWTSLVRPPTSVTGPEKLRSMREYGDGSLPETFEYDHLIPLELGGAVNDSRNLWPEPRALPGGLGASGKDAVENALRRRVCDGTLGLRAAQRVMTRDWRTAR